MNKTSKIPKHISNSKYLQNTIYNYNIGDNEEGNVNQESNTNNQSKYYYKFNLKLKIYRNPHYNNNLKSQNSKNYQYLNKNSYNKVNLILFTKIMI